MGLEADTASIHRLLAAGEAFVPGMAGELGGHEPGAVTPGYECREAIAGLIGALARRHPEAGRGFWALRAWILLTWQPAVLAFLAVHRIGGVPSLRGISQRVEVAAVLGYRLPEGAVATGRTEVLIARAGCDLRALAEDLLAALNAVAPVKPVLACRLLADRVLSLLLNLGEPGWGLSSAEIRDAAACWMAATGLEGQSGLMTIDLDCGGERLALDRKACCLEYLLDPGALCATCPRQSAEIRVGRLREQLRA